MDGLALLCNLFADGPVTLRRLRLARVRTLDDVERAPSERLAECLHASVPQARAFAEEARRLERRLADDGPSRGPLPARPLTRERHVRARPEAVLAPGVLPGLDEALCERLARHNVRTLRSLADGAGLELARRSGIPYARLLDLARCARRLPAPAAEPPSPAEPGATTPYELTPFLAVPPPAPLEAEFLASDGFTMPPPEPGSAGPFG
jgi:hypothetical protein